MKTTKTQFLGKRLLIPLVLVEIAAVGVGLSFPASSTSLTNLQSNESAAKSQFISKEVAELNLLAQQPTPPPVPPKDPPKPRPKRPGCPWYRRLIGRC